MTETIVEGLNYGIAKAIENSLSRESQVSRRGAFEAFKKSGLPGPKSEEYRFTPITRHLEKHFKAEDFTKRTPSSVNNIDEFLIPGYACNLIVFVNGQYQQHLSKIISPSDRLNISPLADALELNVTASEYFTKVAPSSDAFSGLNTALWQDGVYIEVPENTHVETPVFILHLNDAAQKNVVSQTRLLMVIGKGSEISIVEKFNSKGSNPIFVSSVEEIEVKEGATLNYHRLQNDNGAVYQHSSTFIHQNDKSRVNTFTLTLDGKLIRNNLNIIVDGEGCESHFYGLYLLDNDTLADNHTVVDHLRPNSFSNELYKGVMDGKSKGVFNGKIYVRPHAQKTNAFQSNRNILLTDTATVNTKPQLEIWADDVKCSHGCTSGQLDEEALFYLQSRGISKHTARAMVLYAFAGEVVAVMKDLSLKSYLDNLISERLQKKL